MHWTEEFFDEYYLKSSHYLTSADHTEKEVDFLLDHVEITKESAILDLACGQGRHAIALAKRGYQNITGLDLTEPYIKMARERSQGLEFPPAFVQGNMSDFSEQNKYDLIYSLFSSMFYFDDTHNLDILQRIYNGLKRDGYFVIDYFNPLHFLKINKKKDWYITDDDYLILEKFSHNPISGMITTERLIITPEGKRIKRMFHVRDYTPAELRYHFEHIGFEIVRVFGNFDGDEYTLDAPRQIFITRKPE
ncbi:MAG TPA: class I SAM-dependent methyltransferase [Caldithrix abyssi]|uniref:Class I SAM-dependent methyltransferase n=1 Tax=Caldithrix abyssi TaxID=187145 RepID=A0A7V4U0C5_CALAY|nr:class I SAM-dependent methyltransferase [Caldithrix abyssi]